MSREFAWGEGPEFHTIASWKCEICGKELKATAAQAHEAEWDTPPYFSGYVKCESCPITGLRMFAGRPGVSGG